METIVANLVGGQTRQEHFNGRDYLVAPVVMIVPGVLNGSDGALLYPPEDTAANPGLWNHQPLVLRHPVRNGQHVSARDPDILREQGLGYVFKDSYDGKRRAEAWFDVEATRNQDAKLPEKSKILPRLHRGEAIEVSTGLFVDREEAQQGAVFNGEDAEGKPYSRPYTHVARNYRADHLAVLPDEKGACSVSDGCGVLVNDSTANVNPKGCNQHKKCMGVIATDTQKIAIRDMMSDHFTHAGPSRITAVVNLVADYAKRAPDGLDAAMRYVEHHVRSMANRGEPGDEHYAGIADALYDKRKDILKVLREPITHNDDATANTNSNDITEANDMNREQLTQWLTANCSCWKGKSAVLNGKDDKGNPAFSDDELKTLKASAEAAAQTAAQTANVAKLFKDGVKLGDGMLTINAQTGKPVLRNADGTECEPTEAACRAMMKEKKPMANATNPDGDAVTINAEQQRQIELGIAKSLGFASVDQMKATLNVAKDVELEKRQQLVAKLIANVAPNRQEAKAKQLMAKDVQELQELLELIPSTPVSNSDLNADVQGVLRLLPNYGGQGVGAPHGVKDDSDNVLPMPVVNWSEMSPLSRKQQA